MRQEEKLDPQSLREEVKEIRKQIDDMAEKRHKERYESLYATAPPEMQRHLQVASAKGASNWVTAMPSFDHDTVLHKGEFSDAIYMRYGWEITDTPIDVRMWSKLQHAARSRLHAGRISNNPVQ
jgi:hypothetical protein